MLTEQLIEQVTTFSSNVREKWEDIKDNILLGDIENRRFLLAQDPISQELKSQLRDFGTMSEKRQLRVSLYTRKRAIMGVKDPDSLIQAEYKIREIQRFEELLNVVLDNLVIVQDPDISRELLSKF